MIWAVRGNDVRGAKGPVRPSHPSHSRPIAPHLCIRTVFAKLSEIELRAELE